MVLRSLFDGGGLRRSDFRLRRFGTAV